MNKKIRISRGQIRKKLKNVDGESRKTRKRSGKSHGIPHLKFGRHPASPN